MFFQSQAVNLVTATLQAAINQADRQRKERAEKQLLLYQGEQEIFIQANLARTHQNPENLTPAGFNIVKKIIRALAMVYNQDAKRRIEGSEKDQEIFNQIETTANLAVTMKAANRLSKLLGTVLLRPLWRNGKMELDIILPDVADVQWGDTPADLLEVVVTQNCQNGQASGVTYSKWTPELFQLYNHNGKFLEEYENPYGRLPFVPIWSEPPLDNFWLPGATDLIMIQDAINSILTDLLYTMRFQSYSLLYTKGAGLEAQKQLTVGPGRCIHLPKDADIGFSSPAAKIAEALAAVENLVKQAAMSNGLSAASVNIRPTEESGRAKLVSNAELEEMRSDDLALFARYEDQLFDLFRSIWNIHNTGRTISPEAVLWCQFYQSEPSQTPFEKTSNFRALVDLGVWSKVDVVMALNPDLDRETATRQLEATQAEITKFDEINMPSLAGFNFPSE